MLAFLRLAKKHLDTPLCDASKAAALKEEGNYRLLIDPVGAERIMAEEKEAVIKYDVLHMMKETFKWKSDLARLVNRYDNSISRVEKVQIEKEIASTELIIDITRERVEWKLAGT